MTPGHCLTRKIAPQLPIHVRARATFGVVLGLGLALAGPAWAQSSGNGFLFKQPIGSFAVRGGFAHASAGSDIFSFSREQLTLGRGDFSGLALGTDVAFRVAQRVDLVLGAAYSGGSADSEFRDWVDDLDRPIEQTTTFQRIPVTATAKVYLTPRGRSIGRFAWLPARFAPYIGGGGGAMWYRFRQRGDFVDFETLDVFGDEFESSGWTATAHALGGVDFSLTPRLALTGEARYTYAKASLDDDFEGFDRIDLSGISTTIGLSIRF
ncbi:MAG: hypothetical protein ACREON_08620 [Gemmatimonadaceae bacterium]